MSDNVREDQPLIDCLISPNLLPQATDISRRREAERRV